MFIETMRAAIAGARTLAQLDELSRQTWHAAGADAVDEAGAQSLAELIHARRLVVRGDIRPVGIPSGRASLFPPRRPTTSPDRLASRDRRRLLAASGPMPPQLAARFTTGQLAVLRIVGDEVAAKGVCGLCVDAIAARAGVCRRLAQAAIRLAEGDGLLTIQERRHEGRKSDPNLVRILSREWLAWLRRGRRPSSPPGSIEAAPVLKGGGCKPLHSTDKGSKSRTVRAMRNSGVASPQSSSLAPAAHAPGGGGAPRPAHHAASGTGANAAGRQRSL